VRNEEEATARREKLLAYEILKAAGLVEVLVNH
jgi:hypothetical protein